MTLAAQGSAPADEASEAAKGAYPRTLNRQIHGLRGFAALAVFVYHVYGMADLWGFWPPTLNWSTGFFIAGRHGVEIFFVISGYLITGSLIRHQSAARFLVDRAIRIYPVFMTIQILVFAVGPVIHYKWMAGISAVDWLKAFMSNAIFLPGILDLPLAQLNAWSLSYEAAFYLISAAVFLVAAATRPWIAALILAVALVPILNLYPKAAFFPIGAATYFVTTRGMAVLPGFFRLLSLPALLVTLAFLAWSETRPEMLWGALIPAAIFFWSIVDGNCPLSAILRTSGLQYVGTVSYSFYLWSPVVTFPMKIVIQKYLHGRVDDTINVALFAIVGFAASLVVARISYLVLEDWAGRRLHRLAWGR